MIKKLKNIALTAMAVFSTIFIVIAAVICAGTVIYGAIQWIK